MKLGMNLVCLTAGRQGTYRTHEEAARLCREAGFDNVDVHVNFTENPDYLSIASDLRRQYDAAGCLPCPCSRLWKMPSSMA